MIRSIYLLMTIAVAMCLLAAPNPSGTGAWAAVYDAASSHSSGGAAGDDPSGQAVLDGWAEALGGRDRLAQAKTWHIENKITAFGLEGTIHEWYTADGNHRMELDLAGLFGITIVRTPENCWLMDQNGKVSEMAGKDLQDEISQVYLGTWSHLLKGRMKGEVPLIGTDTETGQLTVIAAPDGGTEMTFFLDPESFLPVNHRMIAGSGETQTATYDNWKDMDGIRYPGTLKVSTGVPQNDQLYELVSVEYNVDPPAGAFARPSESADDARFASGNEARDIPIDLNGVHIFLQGRINDSEPLWFILDTGASVTCVDSRVASDLGFELEGEIMAGGAGENRVEANFIKDATFSVPGVEVIGQTVATIALGDILEKRFGRPIDGILGYDFISRFVVTIDYLNSQLHLHHRDGWKYQGSGTVVPIRLVGSSPRCDATITVSGREPIACELLVDIGAGSALIFGKPFSDEHDLLAALPRKILFEGGYGIGGASRDYLGRVESLQLGDLVFKAPFAMFSQDERGAGADRTFAGLLGGRTLEQCTVIFDYERNRMILEPNERFGSDIHFDMCGIVYDTGGRGDWHTFTVSHVVEGSAAEKAGLEVGDVILSVDGKPASELWKVDIMKIFRQDGREVHLEIDRDGKTLKKVIHLEPVI
jgi:hypothetical protein